MVKPVVAFGDPVLKAEAVEIEKNHSGLNSLIEDMWETMYDAEGVGLAAPQVGESIRLFIVDGAPFSEGDDGDKECDGFKRVMINPVIFELSSDQSVMEEGCLSIPGIREGVSRPNSIKIEYFDENWELVEEDLKGIAARIVQHEYDHLDGIMITDHFTTEKRRLLHGKLRDIGLGKVPVDYRMRL
ncbi:MAG TPA: peptide deformylase, partial [Flavobacteriales bacterium]|nr:peptide deformylase [Flavobacteriales bacterium]